MKPFDFPPDSEPWWQPLLGVLLFGLLFLTALVLL